VLKLNPNPTFTWPVKFMSPEGEQTLLAVFRHMPKAAYDEWWEAAWNRSRAYNEALQAWVEAGVKAKDEAKAAGQPEPADPPKPTPEQFGLGLDEIVGRDASDGRDEIKGFLVGWQEVDAPFSRDAVKHLLGNYHDLNIKKLSEAWIEGLQQRKLEN
jgi:hypothetical protein